MPEFIPDPFRVQMLVDPAPKFLGELGKCGQQWAVKISGKLGG